MIISSGIFRVVVVVNLLLSLIKFSFIGELAITGDEVKFEVFECFSMDIDSGVVIEIYY